MARPTLDRNPKYLALIKRLGVARSMVRGSLEHLWDSCHESGNPILRPHHVEPTADWPGDPGAFLAALIEEGFLDKREDGTVEVHDYWDHAPDYVRKRKHREDARKGNYPADNGGQRRTTADNGAPPSPSPSPTLKEIPTTAPATRVREDEPPPPEPPQPPAEPQADPNRFPRARDAAETFHGFHNRLSQPCLEVAGEYQMRRYGGPNPSAPWYPILLREIASVLEVSDDLDRDRRKLIDTIRSPPQPQLRRDASFSQIAYFCGVKQRPEGLTYASPGPPRRDRNAQAKAGGKPAHAPGGGRHAELETPTF